MRSLRTSLSLVGLLVLCGSAAPAPAEAEVVRIGRVAAASTAPTQKELLILHPLSFCRGPEGGGEPWVISGDTGIHPSAAGYAQMAAQVPPPAG